MILTDQAIAEMLAPVVAGEIVVPYPGTWGRPPYALRAGRPVVADDPGLSALAVDRDRGTVVYLDDRGEVVINGSLAALVECGRRYTAAINTAEVEDADDSWEAIGRDLQAQFRAIDPGLTDSEDTFWAVIAEEVGYGLRAPARTPATPQPVASAKTQLLLAMTDEHRDAVFTPEQWRRLSAATDVTVAPPLHRLSLALDAIAQLAPLRGRPVPRPQVLVYADHSDAPGGEVDITPDLLNRLPAVRLICHLAVPDGTQPPSASGITTAAIDINDPTTAILAAIAAEGL